MAGEIPSGTVTFLFTDIEASTRLWEASPEEMVVAVARHDELTREIVSARGGHVFTTAGDSFAVAFDRAASAVEVAEELQRALGEERWADAVPVRVRMGVHTGEAAERDRDYFGPEVNRAARLMSLAHGGQVLVSDITAAVAGLPGDRLVDLGEHRLKDLSEPLRIFQLAGEGLESEFAPLRSVPVGRSNLPLVRTSFVGRSREVEQLVSVLVPGALVALTGPGGAGKTRLGLQAAAAVSERFAGGIWMVELASVKDAAAVPDHAVRELGVAVMAGTRPETAMAEWIGDERVLLMIDNCEHLLDAAADLIEELRLRCPLLCVLATSRESLGLDGELVVASTPLSLEDSIALFCERAGLSAIDLSGDHESAIAELCGHLDGLPLAVELAAARTRSLTPGEINRRLGDRFRLLGGSKRARSDRQRTLRTTIDWSYRLLEDEERNLFCRLAVFVGSFDLDAVETVAEVDALDAVDIVDRLVDKSMVVADTTGERPTYRMLESLRDYGLEHVVDLDSLRALHADHYGSLVQRLIPELRSPQEATALAELDQAWDDIRAAVDWAVDAGDTDRAPELVRGLGLEAHIRLRGEVGTWAERVLELAEISESRHFAELAGTSAHLAALAGDLALATQRADQAARARPVGPATYSDLLPGFFVAFFGGDMEQAAAVSHAIKDVKDLDRDIVEAVAACHLISVKGYLDPHADFETDRAAISRLDKSAISPSLLAWVTLPLGFSYMATEPEAARSVFKNQVLPIADEVPIHWVAASAASYLTAIDLELDDPTTSLRRFQRLLTGMLESRNNVAAGSVLRRFACLLGRLQRYEPALAVATFVDRRPFGRYLPAEIADRLDELYSSARKALTRNEIDRLHARAETWDIRSALHEALGEIELILHSNEV